MHFYTVVKLQSLADLKTLFIVRSFISPAPTDISDHCLVTRYTRTFISYHIKHQRGPGLKLDLKVLYSSVTHERQVNLNTNRINPIT